MMRASSFFSDRRNCRRRPGIGLVGFAAWLLLGLALSAAPTRAQYQNPGSPIQPEAPVPGTSPDRPRFSVDATLQLGETGKPTVRLDYRMSRSELLFERTAPAGYHAAYEIRVIFYSAKGKRQVTGDTYSRHLEASSYSGTRVRGEDINDHLDFQVPPGKYRIGVVITDLVAERASGTAIDFEVPSTPPGLVWFSDVTLGTIDVTAGSEPHFVPNPSRRYGDNVTAFAASGEIFDQRAADQADSTYPISYRIVSESGEQVVIGDTSLARQSGRTPFLLRPRVTGLGPGSYRFLVALTTRPLAGAKSAKANVIRRDKPFDVDQSRATIGFASSQSLDVLRYIATREESDQIDKLETQGEDARKAFWDEFWKRRDPSPETPENEALSDFYQRVQYANQHFSTGTPGWKTDMGRIYILFGRPDEVVRNPFNFDRPPEEIWYYYRDHRTFVFVDRDGFGRYELLTPPAGP
jgi:GWxTD domain-containing protein